MIHPIIDCVFSGRKGNYSEDDIPCARDLHGRTKPLGKVSLPRMSYHLFGAEYMTEYKLFAQRIGLVGLVSLLSNLSGLILLPVLTKNIPLSDYGIWTQVNITMGLAGSIILMGLSESLTRFMASSKERSEIQERFYSIFFMILSSGFVFSTLVYVFSEPIATALFGGNLLVTRLLCGILLLESMNSLFLYYFRTVQQMKRYSILVFTNVYLNIAFISALVLMGYGILGAVVALLITRVIIFLAMLILIISDIGFRWPEFKDARAYLAFGLPSSSKQSLQLGDEFKRPICYRSATGNLCSGHILAWIPIGQHYRHVHRTAELRSSGDTIQTL